MWRAGAAGNPSTSHEQAIAWGTLPLSELHVMCLSTCELVPPIPSLQISCSDGKLGHGVLA